MHEDPKDNCLCGHVRKEHEWSIGAFEIPSPGNWSWCRGCLNIEWNPLTHRPIHRHEFQLDNLMYIEKLAKEKGLI
jgi:hypothetical protein